MKTLTLALAPLLLGGLAATAHATTTAHKDVPYEVVNYSDLNIANNADAAILLQRVKDAAHRVCSRDVALLPLDFHNPVQRCASAATARAMADVNGRTAVVAYVRR
jgi:UrcA family protein